MNLTTQRLRIRNLQAEDLAMFFVYRSNPEVCKYQGFDVMTIKQAADFIAKESCRQFGSPGEWVQYGIECNERNEIVGDCAIRLTQQDSRIAEIGITISHVEQRKGYAKEAIMAILDFLFDTQGVRRVVEIVDAENIQSIKLLKSIGFRQEGHFIENIFFKGKWGSEFQFAMLKKEWEAIKLKKISNKNFGELFNIVYNQHGFNLKRYKMKRTHLLFLGMLFLLFSGFQPSDRKAQKLQKEKEMTELINSGKFKFVANSAHSSLGTFNNLGASYELVFDGLKLKAYLPYYGKAYSAPMPGEGGVKFDLIADKIEKKWNEKKKTCSISTKVSDPKDSYSIEFAATASGYGDLRISFRSREMISYSGTIQKPDEK